MPCDLERLFGNLLLITELYSIVEVGDANMKDMGSQKTIREISKSVVIIT